MRKEVIYRYAPYLKVAKIIILPCLKGDGLLHCMPVAGSFLLLCLVICQRECAANGFRAVPSTLARGELLFFYINFHFHASIGSLVQDLIYKMNAINECMK